MAEELGTGRHASACLARFRRSQAIEQADAWTAAEDTRLAQAIMQHGRNWQARKSCSIPFDNPFMQIFEL